MADLVSKIASAYLETRWSWPRRHGLVAPFAFVLADPRAIRVTVRVEKPDVIPGAIVGVEIERRRDGA